MIVLYLILSLIVGVFLLAKFRKNNIISLTHLRQKRETPNSNYFKFHGLDCHYTDEGKGPVVLLIHGLGDSFLIFEKILPKFSKDYRVIRLDLPGFGLSDIPQSFGQEEDAIDFYRSFIKNFLDEKQLDKVHLVGNSLGGLVSWEFGVNNQDRLLSLCLLASAGYEMDVVLKNITKGVLHLLPKFLLRNGMPIGIATKNISMVIARKEYRTSSFIEIHSDMINREGVLSYLLKLVSFKEIPDTNELNSFKIPTLIAWGDRDKLTPVRHADYFQKDIQHSEKIVYDKCGHYPHIEHMEKFYEDWSTFIGKIKEK